MGRVVNGLLLVGATEGFLVHKTENIKQVELLLVSECSLRKHLGWIVATRHSPRNLEHAQLLHS